MGWPSHFYDDPTAVADVDYWSKMPEWSLEEIVALSLGKDPRVVSSDKFVHGTRGTEFSAAYFTRLEIVGRNHLANQLGDSTPPIKVIEWANVIEFSFPTELIEAVRLVDQRRRGKTRPTKSALRIASPDTQDEKRISEHERKSLLKMVIGMAVAKYDYDPDRKRNSAAGQISNDLQLHGVSLSDETITKYLNEAAGFLIR